MATWTWQHDKTSVSNGQPWPGTESRTALTVFRGHLQNLRKNRRRLNWVIIELGPWTWIRHSEETLLYFLFEEANLRHQSLDYYQQMILLKDYYCPLSRIQRKIYNRKRNQLLIWTRVVLKWTTWNQMHWSESRLFFSFCDLEGTTRFYSQCSAVGPSFTAVKEELEFP